MFDGLTLLIVVVRLLFYVDDVIPDVLVLFLLPSDRYREMCPELVLDY